MNDGQSTKYFHQVILAIEMTLNIKKTVELQIYLMFDLSNNLMSIKYEIKSL